MSDALVQSSFQAILITMKIAQYHSTALNLGIVSVGATLCAEDSIYRLSLIQEATVTALYRG